MREVEEEQSNSEYDELSVGGTNITELRYADDTALFSTTPECLNNLVQAVNKHSAAYKLSIHHHHLYSYTEYNIKYQIH